MILSAKKIKALTKIASVDNLRSALTGVYLDLKTGIAEACNSIVSVRVNAKVDLLDGDYPTSNTVVSLEEEGSINIAPKIFKVAKTSEKNITIPEIDETILISHADEENIFATVNKDDRSMIKLLPEYPKVDEVIWSKLPQDSDTISQTYSLDHLLKVLTSLKEVGCAYVTQKVSIVNRFVEFVGRSLQDDKLYARAVIMNQDDPKVSKEIKKYFSYEYEYTEDNATTQVKSDKEFETEEGCKVAFLIDIRDSIPGHKLCNVTYKIKKIFKFIQTQPEYIHYREEDFVVKQKEELPLTPEEQNAMNELTDGPGSSDSAIVQQEACTQADDSIDTFDQTDKEITDPNPEFTKVLIKGIKTPVKSGEQQSAEYLNDLIKEDDKSKPVGWTDKYSDKEPDSKIIEDIEELAADVDAILEGDKIPDELHYDLGIAIIETLREDDEFRYMDAGWTWWDIPENVQGVLEDLKIIDKFDNPRIIIAQYNPNDSRDTNDIDLLYVLNGNDKVFKLIDTEEKPKDSNADLSAEWNKIYKKYPDYLILLRNNGRYYTFYTQAEYLNSMGDTRILFGCKNSVTYAYFDTVVVDLIIKRLISDGVKVCRADDISNVKLEEPGMYPNHNKRWTLEDEEKLEFLWKAGKTIEDLSEIFGRKPDGIVKRLEKMQLIEHGTETPAGAVVKETAAKPKEEPKEETKPKDDIPEGYKLFPGDPSLIKKGSVVILKSEQEAGKFTMTDSIKLTLKSFPIWNMTVTVWGNYAPTGFTQEKLPYYILPYSFIKYYKDGENV